MVQKYQNLAPKIIDLRKSLGDKTQEAFGKRFKEPVKRSSIAHWETARSEPTIEQIVEMASFKGDRAWWHVLYLLDDKVSNLDTVDYNKDGTRQHWMTPKELAEMGNDEDEQEYWEWRTKQESLPPSEGPLSEALKLEPSKMAEAVSNLLNGGLKHPRTPLDFSRDEINPINQGIGALTQYSEFAVAEEEKRWKSRTKNFKQAVFHALNYHIDEVDKYVDAIFKKGTIRGRADYYDGTSLILIVTEQVKFKNEALGRNLGKLFLLEKMSGSLVNKMLAVCVDMENPKVHYAMLDDVSAARTMGINLTYVAAMEEKELAAEIFEFVKTNREKKSVKVKGSLVVGSNETLTIKDGHTVQVEK